MVRWWSRCNWSKNWKGSRIVLSYMWNEIRDEMVGAARKALCYVGACARVGKESYSVRNWSAQRHVYLLVRQQCRRQFRMYARRWKERWSVLNWCASKKPSEMYCDLMMAAIWDMGNNHEGQYRLLNCALGFVDCNCQYRMHQVLEVQCSMLWMWSRLYKHVCAWNLKRFSLCLFCGPVHKVRSSLRSREI